MPNLLVLYLALGLGVARLLGKARPEYRDAVSGLIAVIAWPFYLLGELADIITEGLGIKHG